MGAPITLYALRVESLRLFELAIIHIVTTLFELAILHIIRVAPQTSLILGIVATPSVPLVINPSQYLAKLY